MIIGYLLAVAAALGSGTGSVLESIGIKRAGAFGGDTDDLGKIGRQADLLPGRRHRHRLVRGRRRRAAPAPRCSWSSPRSRSASVSLPSSPR